MPKLQYTIQEQDAIFLGFWDRFSSQILNNEGVVDFPANGELRPHHITTVIRLPKEISERLFNEVKSVCPLDYHYPVEDIHLTIVNIDQLLNSKGGITWDKLGLDISKAIKDLPLPKFRIEGLGIFPTTIFAQIYDVNGVLELYRSRITKAVIEHLSLEIDNDEVTALVPGITFANLVRFKRKPEPSLVEFVQDRRELKVGVFEADKFDIVTTNKLLSSNGTVLNATIKL